MKFAKIPMATINRLSIYLRNLDELLANDIDVISSEKLAKQCGVNPAQIRKDLAYFGEFGVRGVGYRVEDLNSHIKEILGLNRKWNMALFGVGNLGSALIRHANFLKHGYRFVAAFDVDSAKVGKTLPNGLVIEYVDRFEEIAFFLPQATLNRHVEKKLALLRQLEEQYTQVAAFQSPRLPESVYQIGMTYENFARTWSNQEIPSISPDTA